MADPITRRTFLQTTGQTAAAVAAGASPALSLGPAPVHAAGRSASASDKIVVGLVGCGYRGRANLRDFRRLIDRKDKDVDALIVRPIGGTPTWPLPPCRRASRFQALPKRMPRCSGGRTSYGCSRRGTPMRISAR